MSGGALPENDTRCPIILFVTDPSVPAVVTGYLERHAVADPRVVPLTGDASDRRYFRILPRDGEPFVPAFVSASMWSFEVERRRPSARCWYFGHNRFLIAVIEECQLPSRVQE